MFILVKQSWRSYFFAEELEIATEENWNPQQQISEENEQKALNYLRVRCSLLLRSYTGVSGEMLSPTEVIHRGEWWDALSYWGHTQGWVVRCSLLLRSYTGVSGEMLSPTEVIHRGDWWDALSYWGHTQGGVIVIVVEVSEYFGIAG